MATVSLHSGQHASMNNDMEEPRKKPIIFTFSYISEGSPSFFLIVAFYVKEKCEYCIFGENVYFCFCTLQPGYNDEIIASVRPTIASQTFLKMVLPNWFLKHLRSSCCVLKSHGSIVPLSDDPLHLCNEERKAFII